MQNPDVILWCFFVTATTLPVFAQGSSTECKGEHKKIERLTAGNYAWKIDHLEIMSEALDQCMLNSSEMCLDIKYKNNKYVHLCLKKERDGKYFKPEQSDIFSTK